MCQGREDAAENKHAKCLHPDFTEMLQIVETLTQQTLQDRKRETGLDVLISMQNVAGTGQESQGSVSAMQTSAVSVDANRGSENRSFPNCKK